MMKLKRKQEIIAERKEKDRLEREKVKLEKERAMKE